MIARAVVAALLAAAMAGPAAAATGPALIVASVASEIHLNMVPVYAVGAAVLLICVGIRALRWMAMAIAIGGVNRDANTHRGM